MDRIRIRLAFVALLATLAAPICGAGDARAHPHVWIIASGQLMYAPDGTLTGIRYAWEFDDMFSSFAQQGLDTNKDGKLSREELAELAQTNIESLKEFDYFTFAKAGSRKLAFAEPKDYYLEQQNNVLVLHFTLPLAKPQAARGETKIEVYDPTMFVSFGFADGETAVALTSAPQGCKLAVERPQPLQPGQPLTLSEAFFNSLATNSDFGAQFANRATVTCP